MTDNNAGTPPVDDESTGASKKFIASAVVVAAIVVLGLVLSLTNLLGGKTEPTNTSAPSPSTTATASSSATPSDASVCGLTPVEMSGTVSTAPTATWALVGTTAAPSIKGQGPGKVEEDGYRSCYARTPTGALLAAANYTALGSYGPLRKKFYEEATVPGPGRDALLRKPITGAGGGGAGADRRDRGRLPDLAGLAGGFRVLRYDGK